jgi:hypothetical protein
MSTNVLADVAESFGCAARALEIMQTHVGVYTAAASWPAADRARFAAQASFDAYFDHLAAAYRRLDGNGRKV